MKKAEKEWIEKAIKSLVIDGRSKLFTRIELLEKDMTIDATKAIGHAYFLKLDGNGRPRVNDLIELVVSKIVDYSLPKKEVDIAKKDLDETGSTSKILELQKKAKKLFVELDKSGEFGEMLLYILVQEVLDLPQLISKMSLKTTGKIHYQGADGIHVKYDSKSEGLILYWGESKMEKDLTTALRNCFKSLKGFLIDTFGAESTQTRDIELIKGHLSENINNEKLENELVRYFDLDDDNSNKLKYNGVCFVGFDHDKYPDKPNQSTIDDLREIFDTELKDWLKKVKNQINKHADLDTFEIHVFIIPFPSVQEIRDKFLDHISS